MTKITVKRALTAIIITVVIIATTLTALAVVHHTTTPTEDTTTEYVVRAEVISVGEEDADLVLCEDVEGNVWSFYQEEEYTEGEYVLLLINDNATEIINDDEIISVRIDPFAY